MAEIDVPIQTWVEFDKMEINVLNHILFQEVTVEVTLRNKIVATNVVRHSFKIEGIEYQKWGEDDYYILQLVATKLGITLPN